MSVFTKDAFSQDTTLFQIVILFRHFEAP